MRIAPILILLLLLSGIPSIGSAATSIPATVLPDGTTLVKEDLPGDRVKCVVVPGQFTVDMATRSSSSLPADYRISVGDEVTIQVIGKVDLHFGMGWGSGQGSDATHEPNAPKSFEVTPDGCLHLPLIGKIEAKGRTVSDVKEEVKTKLTAFYKHFSLEMTVTLPGLRKVWIGGNVSNPGPQSLSSSVTVLEAVLRADILPTGSTRLVQLTRRGETKTFDIYSIVVTGDLEGNTPLETGDQIYVPTATSWVTVNGEVSRPGQYEMVTYESSDKSAFRVCDLLSLSQGLLPTAAQSNVVIKRRSADGEMQAIHVNLLQKEDLELQSGDEVTIPSIADYQPTVRLVGEFKGEGVYQRSAGTVLNKSGVYSLSKGETAGDVIIRTGGTTPQANFSRAKIERRKDNKVEVIPLDLDRLITKQDKTADVPLESGDTIVLPALQDKVYVFGQVQKPGGFDYEPDRRVLDYLARAGGPGSRAKSSMVVIRGSSDKPEIMKIAISKGMRGQESSNPILQPGDVLYVPQGVVTDWRDLSQIISTVRLLMLF